METEASFVSERLLDGVYASAFFGERVWISYFDATLALEVVSTTTFAHTPARTHLCSFFDALPQQILPNILRSVSKGPWADNWFAWFGEADAFPILQSTTPLSTAAEECFDGMYLGIAERLYSMKIHFISTTGWSSKEVVYALSLSTGRDHGC